MEKSKVSLHNHLGRNGNNPGFDETIDIIYRGLGAGGVFGIANCNDFRFEKFVFQPNQRYERTFIGYNIKQPVAVYIPDKQIMIIRGQEVFSDKGHFLVFGYERNIERTGLDDGLHEATDKMEIIGTDNRYYISGLGKFLEKNPSYEGYFDFDEAYNGTSEIGKWFVGPRDANEKSIEHYQKNIRGNVFENPRNGKKHLIGACSFGDTHQIKRFSGNLTGKSHTMMDLNFMQNPDQIKGPEWIDEFRYKLHYSTIKDCAMKPNKWDALCHVFNLTIVNKIEKIAGLTFHEKADNLDKIIG